MNDVLTSRADRTRHTLLASAWQIVRQEGLASLTMRRLAAEARVSVGNAYAHFVDQGALIEDLRILAWDEMEKAISAEVEPEIQAQSPPNCEAALRAIIASVVRFAAREPHLQELIYLGPGTVFSPRVMQRDLAAATRFVGLFYVGVQTGEFVMQSDPKIVALALWTAVQGQLQRMAATMPDEYRHLQSQALHEILAAFFDHIRRP